MLKFWKKNRSGKTYLFEEKPENKNVELTGESIKTLLSDSQDIIFQQLYINGNKSLEVTLCYVDGLINFKIVNDDILKPLLQEVSLSQSKNSRDIIDLIGHARFILPLKNLGENINDTIHDILNGSVALIFSKDKLAVTFNAKGFEKRGIQEPSNENITKGAKDAFIEVLRVNTALVRRKIKSQNLKIKEMVIGQETQTSIAICYIDEIANKNLITEVMSRLEKIDIDGVLTTASIEELIIDNKFSAFPQILYTERSDKFCSNILEGRVGLIIDGLPTSFIIPATINQFMHAPDDYANNYIIASVISILRFFAIILTLILPGFYIAITTFHQELIPTKFALALIASKEGVPFPVFIEVILMLLAFEILMEAGLRMPKSIGQAVSIVGALIVGQSAVEAKLASAAIVIIVALTVISGFTMANQDFANALRFWRFIMTLFAAIAGLLGLTYGFIILVLHLAKIETFGVAYLSPFVANEGEEIFKDSIIRLPMWLLKTRPRDLKSHNRVRQK